MRTEERSLTGARRPLHVRFDVASALRRRSRQRVGMVAALLLVCVLGMGLSACGAAVEHAIRGKAAVNETTKKACITFEKKVPPLLNQFQQTPTQSLRNQMAAEATTLGEAAHGSLTNSVSTFGSHAKDPRWSYQTLLNDLQKVEGDCSPFLTP